MENLISSGCQAIISGYDTNIVAAMSTCADAGVYYVVALDHITEDDFAGTDPGQYFLGGTKQFGGDLAALGKEYADAVADSGITNVGGISFPAWAFPMRLKSTQASRVNCSPRTLQYRILPLPPV